MKHIIHIAATVLAASSLLLCSCQNLEQIEGAAGGKITFKANVGEFTKVKDGAFSDGDVIAISASDPINAQNVPYTFTGGVWASPDELYWASSQTSATTFTAFYPWNPEKCGQDRIDVSVIVNQDVVDYQKCDFMTARTTASPSDGAVALEFRHRMTLIEVNVNTSIADSSLFISYLKMNGIRKDAEYLVSEDKVEALGEPETIDFFTEDWDVSIGTGVTEKFYAIIPPQSAKPELGITLAGGRQYWFSLPESIRLEEGKKYSAQITIEPGQVDANFSFDIYGWFIDDDLQFPNSGEWEYMGKGKYIDGALADIFSVPNYEFEVDVYMDTRNGNRYKLADPYAAWPLAGEIDLDKGELILNVLENGDAYFETCSIGIEDFALESYVEENGWGAESYNYLSQYYNRGCWNSQSKLILGSGGRYYLVDESMMTTFTLPGVIRYPVYYNIMDFSYDEKGNIGFKAGLDLTEIGVAAIPTPCKVTQDLIRSVIDGSCEYQIKHVTDNLGTETYEVKAGFDKTLCCYYIVAGRCIYADGEEYTGYYYIRLPYVVEGQETPECCVELSNAAVSENDPKTIELTAKCRDCSSLIYLAVPSSQAGELESVNLSEYIPANGKNLSINIYSMDTDGQRLAIDGLDTDTEYVIYIYCENAFGKSGVAKISARTGSELRFKSIGTGKYYDQIFHFFLGAEYDELSSYLYSEVEIFQEESGKPIYRAMKPFTGFWGRNKTIEPYYLGTESEYIEFYTVSYPEGNFVRFNDYHPGMYFMDDLNGDGQYEIYDLNYRYYPYSGNPSEHQYTRNNRQLSKGVFQLAPAVWIDGTKYFYPYCQNEEAVIICLPGYDYTFSFEQTKAAFTGSRLPRMECL